MSPIERMQVEDLLHELAQHDDQFNAFVAQLHFLLDSIECLSEHGGELPEQSQYGLHLSTSQLKDKIVELNQSAFYFHAILRDLIQASSRR